MSIKGDAIMLGVAVIAVAAAAWYLKKKVGAVAEGVADSVNPIKIVQSGADTFERWYKAQGQNNTTWGNDVRAIWDVPRDLTNEQIDQLPLGASASRDVYQWLTGSKGNQVSDFNEWLDGWWK